MTSTNAISGSSPINPIVAIPNMPSPQVISGTLGQAGNPAPVIPRLGLASLSNTDLSTLTDCLGTFNIDTAMTPSTELFSTKLPVIKGGYPTSLSPSRTNTVPLNWANVTLCSHMFYNPIQHIGFVLIAPEPIRGKLLITWNPSSTLDLTGPPQYSAKRRMITEEWDLSQSKTFFRSYSPNGLINQMSTEHQHLPRTQGIAGASSFIAPAYEIPSQFRNFGNLSVHVEQEIQVGSIFPRNYTILVFVCFAGTNFSVPVDFRRASFVNEGYSLITAHQNYWLTRFNTRVPPTPRNKTTKGLIKQKMREYLLTNGSLDTPKPF